MQDGDIAAAPSTAHPPSGGMEEAAFAFLRGLVAADYSPAYHRGLARRSAAVRTLSGAVYEDGRCPPRAHRRLRRSDRGRPSGPDDSRRVPGGSAVLSRVGACRLRRRLPMPAGAGSRPDRPRPYCAQHHRPQAFGGAQLPALLRGQRPRWQTSPAPAWFAPKLAAAPSSGAHPRADGAPAGGHGRAKPAGTAG